MSRRNWTDPETVQLTELVFEQREYLRPILRGNMINRIWEGIEEQLKEFGNVRSVSQLKTKWASICNACRNDVTRLDAANLPQEVKNKMRLILEEEASLGQSVDDSDRADENQSSSDENGDPPAQDNTPASPSIAGGSNSSNPDEQNQTERQHNLDSEEQNQDGIENLTGKLENLDCK
ncbi:uncharacterized protein LOC128184373 [Crassostrea angulata]|uniref:uncharacterized protein LOC128184373 n=1 Tax=Magallana angulata TaxID=2784310 RepID=UPI0022B08359|nr:uncharacterized protein LOC128184373 [Crassostrea angulata]